MARKSPRKPHGRRTKVTKRQLKVSEARAQGKTLKESGEAAGYSPKNAAQSAYQALAGLRGRMTALLDEAGLGEKVAIENYLKPALDAQQTIYAQKDGKVVSRGHSWRRAQPVWGRGLVLSKQLPREGRGYPFVSEDGFFPTHNPTHRVRCLARLTRSLAVPSCLVSRCKT
jgi:hypothetical protein